MNLSVFKKIHKIRSYFEHLQDDGSVTTKRVLVYSSWCAISMSSSYLASTLGNMLSFSFVGQRLGVASQAAHGLAFSIGNIIVLAIGLGLINGLDTLCPIAIGARHPMRCWGFLFQALFIVSCLFPFLAVLIYYSEYFLKMIGPGPEVAHLASQYLIYSFPGLYGLSFFEAARKFLTYHQCFAAHCVFAFLCIPIQLFFLWLTIMVFDWGVAGAGAARSLTWVIIGCATYVYIFLVREKFDWSKYIHGDPIETSLMTTAHNINISSLQTLESERKAKDPPTSPGLDACITPVKQGSIPVNIVPVGSPEDAQLKSPRSLHNASHPQDRLALISVNDPPPSLRANETCRLISTKRQSNATLPLEKKTQTKAPEQPSFIQSPSKVFYSEKSHTSADDIGVNVISRDSTYIAVSTPAENVEKITIRFYPHWWQGLGQFLKIAIPSTFLCICEWIGFEIQIIGASRLGDSELASLSAIQSFAGITFLIHLSIGIISNSEIGKAMGSRRPRDALTFAKGSIYLVLLTSTCFCIAVIAFRKQIAYLYTQDTVVHKILSFNLIFQAFATYADGIHAVMMGEIKGLNLQWYGTIIDAVCLLGIMQVTGFLLAYLTPLKSLGFIIASMIAMLINTVAYGILLFGWVNWYKRSMLLSAMKPVSS